MLTMTPDDVLDAVAEGRASLLPTTEGRGLTPDEHGAVLAARHEAVRRFAGRSDGPDDTFVYEAVDVAVSVALRVVLACRPTAAEPARLADTWHAPFTQPATPDDDPWEGTDAFRWELGPDELYQPDPADELWAAESFRRDPRHASAFMIDRETAEAVARGGHDS